MSQQANIDNYSLESIKLEEARQSKQGNSCNINFED